MLRGGRLLIVAALFLVAASALTAFAVWRDLVDYMAEPGPTRAEVAVVIPPGEGMARIVGRLRDAGVIERPWMFRLGARLLGQDRSLKAGEYAFPAAISPRGVLAMLHRGDTVVRRVTVAEGATVAEVLALLAEAPGLTGDLPDPPPPEGSLMPETYFYALGETRGSLVRRMRRAMDEAVAELWPRRPEGLPLSSPAELVTLASIVEKETAVAAERPQVAAVFINRLRRGMRLQSDPTVIYHLTNGAAPLGRPLRRSDLNDSGPYNTYQVGGLPPGPIANPGRDALAAVVEPADVDFLYFVADGTGGHVFARTLDEHNRNVARWRRIQRGEIPPPVRPSPLKPASLPPADSGGGGAAAAEPPAIDGEQRSSAPQPPEASAASDD